VATNQQGEFAGRQAPKSSPVFGTGFWDWPANATQGTEWRAFDMFSGQSFDTLKSLILALGFRPETLFETGHRQTG
jgi:hypothetical protein